MNYRSNREFAYFLLEDALLDPIDNRILDLVQSDAQLAQHEIARRVGLSQPAVAERLRKLEQAGVITGYAALVDAAKLGRDITAFVGVAIGHPKYFEAFARKILSVPEVLECHRVAGEFSYLLKVKTENTKTLDRVLTKVLRVLPGVTRTHTTIALTSVKETTVVPTGSSSIATREEAA
jgi:Lrp/AsnC family transcriptional regulator, leucine-responsive regulatory protein